ncbi:hypothetical protein [Alicyclobacillus shizuokensis]|uniref:hypothetical protein n=1 Tax=Alicyclobacillus shizuokensis TaxID=392014 RepID=UPI0008330E95|nr:hypothetical protein [Alicyclobacillus shizuokensis]
MLIGSKRKKNFVLESQTHELKTNDQVLIVQQKSDGGITNYDLILEPDKFDQLGSEVRLSFEEYCETINDLVTEEEDDWDSLRMKDQINMTRDAILERTILKYAKEKYGLDPEQFNGHDMNYIKRYGSDGSFLGEAVIVTLTMIPTMNAAVKG